MTFAPSAHQPDSSMLKTKVSTNKAKCCQFHSCAYKKFTKASPGVRNKRFTSLVICAGRSKKIKTKTVIHIGIATCNTIFVMKNNWKIYDTTFRSQEHVSASPIDRKSERKQWKGRKIFTNTNIINGWNSKRKMITTVAFEHTQRLNTGNPDSCHTHAK